MIIPKNINPKGMTKKEIANLIQFHFSVNKSLRWMVFKVSIGVHVKDGMVPTLLVSNQKWDLNCADETLLSCWYKNFVAKRDTPK
mmetsp:Transcript_11198/g.15472  ORF Transcript_11198/g.15472 Transcript_11198/m.15472 type:complete len:85 (+) Transcript_11198:120-374(+)